MRIIFIVCFVLLASSTLQAQNNKPKFSSLLQVGLVDGQSGPAATIQSINGVRYQEWSAGIGVGLDYYHTRTVPLFLDVRRNIFKSEKTPFLYLNCGYNFTWLTEEQKGYSYSESKGGLYYDAGIGYAVPVLKQSSLFFTAGYSIKKITTSSGGRPIDIWSSYIPPFYQAEYSLSRISVKAGLRF